MGIASEGQEGLTYCLILMREEDIPYLGAQQIDIDGPAALVGATADDELDVHWCETASLLDEVVELLMRAEPLKLVQTVIVFHHSEEQSF